MTNDENSTVRVLRDVLEHLRQMVGDSSGSCHVRLAELTRHVNTCRECCNVSRDEVYRALYALKSINMTNFIWEPLYNDSIVMRGETATPEDYDLYVEQNPSHTRLILA